MGLSLLSETMGQRGMKDERCMMEKRGINDGKKITAAKRKE
jgi:hypothetical protein